MFVTFLHVDETRVVVVVVVVGGRWRKNKFCAGRLAGPIGFRFDPAFPSQESQTSVKDEICMWI